MTVTWYRNLGMGTDGATAPATTGVEFTQPVRAPTFESDVLVPLARATVTGLLFGLLAATVAVALEWAPFWPFVAPACLSAVALAWLWQLNATDNTLHKAETWTGLDLNHDDAVGPPPAPRLEGHPVVINAAPVTQARAAAEQEADRAYRTNLVAFVEECAHPLGGGTASRRWEPKIGRPRYEEYRNLLIALNVAAWNNPRDPRAGWRLITRPADITRIIQQAPSLPDTNGNSKGGKP